MENKVFVYGSLKSGFGNHGLFRHYDDNTFLGEAKTSQNTFDMFSFGAYPACVREALEGYKIQGEVYLVGPNTLHALDRLEGNGTFYNREMVSVTMDEDGTTTQAWMYLLFDGVPKSRTRVKIIQEDTLTWTKNVHGQYDW